MVSLPRSSSGILGLAVLVAALGLTPAALAQSGAGTTSGQFLLIEPSARLAAQGNVGATARADVQAAYYNPGALAFVTGADAQFTHSAWLADIDYNHFAVGVPMGSAQALSLSITSLGSGDMAVRTPEQPQGTGEQFSVNDLAIALGYGRRFSDRFAGGIQVKYVRETIWHTSSNAAAVDVGVIYELPFQAVLGASISNFGSRAKFSGRDLRIRYDQDPGTFGDNDNLPAALETDQYPLPIFFRVGMSVPVQVGANSELTLAADAFQPSDNSNSVNLGAEWTYADLISARVGYQDLFLEDAEGGLTAGAGINYALGDLGFRFDYAWGDHGDLLGTTQRFTLGLSF